MFVYQLEVPGVFLELPEHGRCHFIVIEVLHLPDELVVRYNGIN